MPIKKCSTRNVGDSRLFIFNSKGLSYINTLKAQAIQSTKSNQILLFGSCSLHLLHYGWVTEIYASSTMFSYTTPRLPWRFRRSLEDHQGRWPVQRCIFNIFIWRFNDFEWIAIFIRLGRRCVFIHFKFFISI